jgi:preprotein translocase subunit SecY
MQLLTPIVPYFQKLQKEGEEGRKKITQYTRYGTVVIAAMQAWGTAIYLQSINLQSGVSVVINPGMGFVALTVLTFTSGTIFIMWLGEQITERGIGNGISLIIFIGIIARLVPAVIDEIQLLFAGVRGIMTELIIVIFLIAVVAAIVLVTRAQRRIPVQYAKRVVGRKVYGGQSTHLPLSVNTAGVIPIIFAQSIMFAPSTLATFFPNNEFVTLITSYFDPSAVTYNLIFATVIVFFAFFYTAIVINPIELAFFAIIAILPNVLIRFAGVTFYFGGTGILIVVGVALDTLQQMESHLIMRHYDGFMKKGRIRGRSM